MLVVSLRAKHRGIAQLPLLLQEGLKRGAVGLESSGAQLVAQADILEVEKRELLLKELLKRMVLTTPVALEVPDVTSGIQIPLGIRWSKGLAAAVPTTGLAVRALKAIGI
jgi:hypothetical protein